MPGALTPQFRPAPLPRRRLPARLHLTVRSHLANMRDNQGGNHNLSKFRRHNLILGQYVYGWGRADGIVI